MHNKCLVFIGLMVSMLTPVSVYAGCTGTYYATEYANGEDQPATGYSLWTFGKFGTLISNSSSEPSVPFSGAQGNWQAVAPRKITTTSFDFSGSNSDSTYPTIAKVDTTFTFTRDCSATVTGKSRYQVTLCPVEQGPLCPSGTVIISDKPIELIRVAGK